MNAKNEFFEKDKSPILKQEDNIKQTNNKDNINIVIPFEESNKKLNTIQEKKIQKNKTPNNNNEDEKNIDLKNKIKKAYKRLDILNLLGSDDFSENFWYYPCKNEMMKLEKNPNYNLEVPYSSIFCDNIFLGDESIFFIHDKTQKQKFLKEKDLKKIKERNIDLNFGEDPSNKYYNILRGNLQNQSKMASIGKLQENLNNFHVFKCRIPNYISANMENFKENELVNIRNNNDYESINSTKINSSTSNLRNNIQLNGNEFMLSNEFNDEDTSKEVKENNGKKYINKKRKLKK
jgi:hypothetical protein